METYYYYYIIFNLKSNPISHILSIHSRIRDPNDSTEIGIGIITLAHRARGENASQPLANGKKAHSLPRKMEIQYKLRLW